MWTREDLQKVIREKMGEYLFIVVTNRQPYLYYFKKGKVEYQRGTGGVISALDPVMQACKGLWVASGSGDADRKVTDTQGKIQVPSDNPNSFHF
jgi:trehalose 6-phosphate synthase